MKHELPKLLYAYDALEPYIDAKTMEIHYTKHHQTYVDKLNAALERHPELQSKTAEELITHLSTIPDEIRMSVRNHGGGHVNHSFFWRILRKGNATNLPEGEIAKTIMDTFGGFEEFKTQFVAAATSLFGSGWCWLILDESGMLKIITTSNQDNPLMQGLFPILGIDVWEHAYYLKYQNKRADYIAAFFSVINWDEVSKIYLDAAIEQ